MNWKKCIPSILGIFWSTICKDSWVVEAIYQFFTHGIGTTIIRRLLCIQSQLSYKAQDLTDVQLPVRFLLDASYKTAVIPLSSLFISTSSLSKIGKETLGVIYKPVLVRDIPSKMLKRVTSPTLSFILNTDYIIQDGCLKFNKPLSELELSTVDITINGVLYICYLLWGVLYSSYKTLRDNFTGILLLPLSWLYKYPSAVLKAWEIRFKGATKLRILQFINCVNTALLSASILTYKDSLADLLHIHVITECGILLALNSDGVPVVNNILPLVGAGYQLYRQLCAYRNNRTTIPYHSLPSTINPVLYIVKKIWKSSALIVLTPYTNIEDMDIAFKFILKNIPKTTVLLIYQNNEEQTRLYPTKLTLLLLEYYKKSKTNGYKRKVE